jgi:hypothetical protein
MASASQINANRENAKKSSGPKTEQGKQTSSQNRLTHGLAIHDTGTFYLLADEDKEQFEAFCLSLQKEQQPQNVMERLLVRRVAEHQWLITRALRFQQHCFFENNHVIAIQALALYLRYQGQHERSFYKALHELQSIRAKRRNVQIGFEAQKQKAEIHNLKKETLACKLEGVKSSATRNKPAGPVENPQKTPPEEFKTTA